MEEYTKYTKIRRFYAWVGFITIIFALFWGLRTLFTLHRVYDIRIERKEQSEPLQSVNAEVSAYTSDPNETDDSPFITASNQLVRDGIVANNCLEFGTEVVIDGKIYEVQDRMNSRYGCNHYDIWMNEKSDAFEWGRRNVTVYIYDN